MSSSTSKKKISRLDQLLNEKKYLLDALGWIRRHDRYMCRNRDGRYSIQDFTLSQFANDIAIKLLVENERDIQIEEEEIKVRTSVARIREHEARLTSLITVDSMRSTVVIVDHEEDARTCLKDLEHVEYEHLLLLSQLQYISPPSKLLSDSCDKKSSSLCMIKWIIWAESAARDDIINGENEDFLHMMSFIASQR